MTTPRTNPETGLMTNYVCRELCEKILNETTREQLDTILDAVKDRRGTLTRKVAQTFKTGDRVSFTHRNGNVELATVIRRKVKNVLVQTDAGVKWNVTATLLRATADDA